MLLPVLISLSTLAVTPPPPGVTSAPAVRVWLSDDGDYRYGDHARVFVQPSADGYLVVLWVDADGRVRPLFPVDPGEDHYARGGRKLEVRGRGDRDAFVVGDTIGRGIVLAAWSASPFAFSAYERTGHWDYRALSDSVAETDPEAHLLDILRVMQPVERFEYDVAPYVVTGSQYTRRPGWAPWPYPRPPRGWWWNDAYGWPHTGVRVTIGSGWPRWYRYPYGVRVIW